MGGIRHLNNAMRTKRTAMTCARRITLAGGTLLTALSAVSGQASAASLVPFQATVAETQTVARCSPIPSLCVTIVGSGHATHLGQIKVTAFVVSNLASNAGPGCVTEMRQTTLTAANGDTITLDATGVNCATGRTTVTAVDTYQVVGGTGRFSRARGSGTITAIINVARRTAVATFSGLLSTPGSLQ